MLTATSVHRESQLPSCPPPAGRFPSHSCIHSGTTGIPKTSRVAWPVIQSAKNKKEYLWWVGENKTNQPNKQKPVSACNIVRILLWCTPEQQVLVLGPKPCRSQEFLQWCGMSGQGSAGTSHLEMEEVKWEKDAWIRHYCKTLTVKIKHIEKIKRGFSYPLHCC